MSLEKPNPATLGARTGLWKMSCVTADDAENAQTGQTPQLQNATRHDLLREYVFEAAQRARNFSAAIQTFVAADDLPGLKYLAHKFGVLAGRVAHGCKELLARLKELIGQKLLGSFVRGLGWRASEIDGLPEPDPVEIEERAGLAMDVVPEVYLDAWARLNCQRPMRVSDADWRQVLDDGGRFLDQWGSLALEFGWTEGELFDVPGAGKSGGLIWWLRGESVTALGKDHAAAGEAMHQRILRKAQPRWRDRLVAGINRCCLH